MRWLSGFFWSPHLFNTRTHSHFEHSKSKLSFLCWSMWSPKSINYSPIHSTDDLQETLTLEKNNDGPVPEMGSWKSVLRSKAFRISIALSTSLLLVLLAFSIFKSKTEHYDCGRSPAQAVSKNCHFDLLAFAWVPIPCFDAEYVFSSWRLSHWSSDN